MKKVKLGDLASIQTGKIDVNKAVAGGKYPFFTCSREAYQINDAPFEGKAVLVAGNGDLNVKYYEGKFNAYQRTYFLFANNENELIPRYLYWFLESYVGRLRSESIGSTIKYIKMGNLTEAEIPLPSLEKQREIVEKLDSAFAEIDSLEDNLALFDSFAEQLLNSLLGASCTASQQMSDSSNILEAQELSLTSQPLGEVFTLEYGKALDKDFRKPDGAFQAYGANGPISSASKYLIEGPCVIVGRKGSAGEITYVEENVWPLDVTYYIKHNSEETDLRYLFYALKSLNIKQFVRGVKPGLNRNDVYELPIQLPSLKRQREIVTKLDFAFSEIKSLRFQFEKQKEYALALRQSLLSNAFIELKEVA
jgi:type I restriction enzyme S subunit